MSSIVRAAGMVVYRRVNHQFEYLLLQASYPPYHWTPPKGHLDPGEDEWAAAVRETKEEAGISIEHLDVHKDFEEVLQYEVKQSRYDGEVTKQKTVRYWLARLVDSDAVKLSDEHQKMKWAPVDEAIHIAQFEDIGKLFRKAEEFLQSKESA
uniref:Bis(5'-nucleosyl)-tetraphosphatase [asymmetrical] n=2 Tax=Ascaris TaxID=6251 RepID=A0A0M3IHP1_ASCLU